MDIKYIGNNLLNIPQTKKVNTQKEVKTDNTTDRDANGQSFSDQQESKKEPLNEGKIKEAIEKLNSISGIKENGLKIEFIHINDKFFIVIKDPENKIIRRIPEQEIYSLLQNSETKFKGSILNKTL